MHSTRVLIVSRQSSVLRPPWVRGEADSWQVETASSGWEALERVQSEPTPDLLLLDVAKGERDGLHILRWLRRIRPELPIIVILASEAELSRLEIIRLGARDCVVYPIDNDGLVSLIKHHVAWPAGNRETDLSSDEIESLGSGYFFVAASPAMRKIRARAEVLAMTNVPVLIVGECGSGKQATAKLIHHLSIRSGLPLLKVNCGAIPGDLLDVELFGRPADPSCSKRKSGKLELCGNGTILLEEVTDLPIPLQSKLLRVLQQSQQASSGTQGQSECGARLVATSSKNGNTIGSHNRLRDDFYFQLSAYTIHLPPLRERREEIPLLLQQFMHQLSKRYGLSPRAFPWAVVDACQSHAWPGNLHELESFVKSYLVGGGDWVLNKHGASPEGIDQNSDAAVPHSQSSLPLQPARQLEVTSSRSDSLKFLVMTAKLQAERTAIANALRKTGWNRKAAARLLGVSYRTLLYKIEQFMMKPPSVLGETQERYEA